MSDLGLLNKYLNLLKKWNNLIDLINEKGGDEFLSKATIGGAEQFSDSELRQIRVLCHPDKHGNSERATQMFQKVNSVMKKEKRSSGLYG